MVVVLSIHKNIHINWETEIEYASGGTFSISNSHDLILTYSQEDLGCFHINSKMAKIRDGKITEIFETKSFLRTPTIDENDDLYVCTHGYDTDEVENKGTLFRINPDGKVVWEYLLDAVSTLNPVIYQDSVLVFDFSGKKQYGHLYRIGKNGTLIWKKSFDGNSFCEPFILKINGQDSILLHAFDDYFILNMNGDTLQKKRLGRPMVGGLSIDEQGNIYACIHPSLLSLDNNMDIIWAYKPDVAFVAYRPIIDSHGNLHCMLQGNRMVSLNAHGKERWIATVTGYFGYSPLVLQDDDILMITIRKSRKRRPQIEDTTYLEIFSIDGIKHLKQELSGFIVDTVLSDNGTIFLSTGCRRVFLSKKQVKNSIKVFSINIS